VTDFARKEADPVYFWGVNFNSIWRSWSGRPWIPSINSM
jgi:hypothetical protein